MGDPDFVDDVHDALGQGKSLSFEDPLQHVFVEASASLNSDVFTISMFIYDREQFSALNRLTSRQGDTLETGINKHFEAQLGELSFYSPSSGWNVSEAIPDIETWHHVAFVADGAEMTVYLDGEEASGPIPFTSSPSGFMHIGNRWNDVEGFDGMIDDVSMFNVALDDDSIAALASGVSPLEVEGCTPPPPEPVFITYATSIDDWKLSTESIDGGDPGDWLSDPDIELPDVETYTLDPLPTDPGIMGHIHSAAQFIGADGIQADSNIHFYRTTFDLDAPISEAEISLPVDNGAQVFINGEFVATEESFLTENWADPMPSIKFLADRTVELTKFDDGVNSFNGWNVGENEVVLVVRNPNTENDPAGGFAFRLAVPVTVVTGDFNNDGMIDATDIDLITTEICEGGTGARFDLNGDGDVSIADRTALIKDVLNTFVGDSNLDGEFSSTDFVVVFQAGQYEDDDALNSTWATGDWNGDKEFNSSDFVAAFQDGGFEQGPRPEPVPEPSGVMAIVAALLLLLRHRSEASANPE